MRVHADDRVGAEPRDQAVPFDDAGTGQRVVLIAAMDHDDHEISLLAGPFDCLRQLAHAQAGHAGFVVCRPAIFVLGHGDHRRPQAVGFGKPGQVALIQVAPAAGVPDPMLVEHLQSVGDAL